MSKLRPELGYGKTTYAPQNGTAYLMVYNAVQAADGLVHGALHKDGWSCAIGSYFDQHPDWGLYDPLIDEVAAVNDSAPHLTKLARKRMVLRWLRWRLGQLGMPGFIGAKQGS